MSLEKSDWIIVKILTQMPERFKVVCIPCKALYKCSALPLPNLSVDKEVPVGPDSLWQKSALSKCSCLLFGSATIEVC